MPYPDADLAGILDFLRRAESLKSTLRSAWTRTGRQESTAAHSWRLGLFAMALAGHLPGLDLGRVLRMCLVHDLGEAIHGDIPAPEQHVSKSGQERQDLVDLLRRSPRRCGRSSRTSGTTTSTPAPPRPAP